MKGQPIYPVELSLVQMEKHDMSMCNEDMQLLWAKYLISDSEFIQISWLFPKIAKYCKSAIYRLAFPSLNELSHSGPGPNITP